MTTPQHSRPWYCRDDIVDEYKTTLSDDGETLPMLKALKILRGIIVNVGILLLVGYAISRGGDPTYLTVAALAVLGAYNGLEIGDYLALLQAYPEVQAETGDD